MANIDTAKQWFKTGDYPTQAQFWQLFEWLRWKDEQLQITDIKDLPDILTDLITNAGGGGATAESFVLSSDGSRTILAGTVISGIVVDTPVAAVLIGRSAGQGDIAVAEAYEGKPAEIVTMVYAKETMELYFTGITQPTTIILLKQTIA